MPEPSDMSDRELMEHVLYELRLANWYTTGRKGKAPTPPNGPRFRPYSGQSLKVRPQSSSGAA